MNILIGCECSGIVREAFRRKGHNAISFDLKPAEDNSPHHYQLDVRRALTNDFVTWDMAIFFPDCTYLTAAGLHWNARRPGRAELTKEAIAFAEYLWTCKIQKVAIENPIGCLSTKSILGEPTQIVQPNWFGDDASKATCLCLRGGLLPLRKTKPVEPRWVGGEPLLFPGMTSGRPRWSNQTDSGQNKLSPSDHRAEDRSRFHPGFAAAMAETWG